MVELFRFLEHVLAEGALEQASRRDGGNMMEATGFHSGCRIDGTVGALDVGGLLGLFVRPHVIHCSKVEEMINVTLERFHRLGVNTQVRAGEVADHCFHPGLIRAPTLPKLVQFFL